MGATLYVPQVLENFETSIEEERYCWIRTQHQALVEFYHYLYILLSWFELTIAAKDLYDHQYHQTRYSLNALVSIASKGRRFASEASRSSQLALQLKVF
jgi:hypothetical protein